MQTRWMENGFRNLTANVWATLDNPIERAMIFQSFDQFLVCCPLMWHSATICDVTTVLVSNWTVHKFHKILLFMKTYLPSTFILRYVRAKNYCACIYDWTWSTGLLISKQIKDCENLCICTKSMETYSLVVSQILTEFHPESAAYKTVHN